MWDLEQERGLWSVQAEVKDSLLLGACAQLGTLSGTEVSMIGRIQYGSYGKFQWKNQHRHLKF